MGWFSTRGKCKDCGYVGAMYSSGCPICNSKDLISSYEGGDGFVFIIAITLVTFFIIGG